MSSFSAHTRTTKKRTYRLGKRAEKQDETRRRIVEAAVDLHCTLGPARTTVSQIAERAGVQVHAEDIEQRIDALRREGYTLVVEGAGGVLAPLTWEKGVGCLFPEDGRKKAPDPFFTVLDLAQRCGLEAVVVGRAGLGTLNHLALTVAALRARAIPIRAVVLNGGSPWPPADPSEATNPDALARMLCGPRIIYVPHHDGVDAPGAPDIVDATVPYLRSLQP